MNAHAQAHLEHGYALERELGHNSEGGRTTWLARDVTLDRRVVIKQFSFARRDASWTGLKAHEREIAMLRTLDHPAIPAWLDAYELPDGFCLVQEHKDAPSLAEVVALRPEQVIAIARHVLDILIVLQAYVPPVLHRDIKPGNILYEPRTGAVFLVDFGLARAGSGNLAVSSIAVGTPGFMAPEQLFGRELTPATDLYGLGATLMCLSCGVRSVDVGSLVSDTFQFDFSRLSGCLAPDFGAWLRRLVAPTAADRYADAKAAREALDAVMRAPAPTAPEHVDGRLRGSIDRVPRSPAHPQNLDTAAITVIVSVLGVALLIAVLAKAIERPRQPVPSEASVATKPLPTPPSPRSMLDKQIGETRNHRDQTNHDVEEEVADRAEVHARRAQALVGQGRLDEALSAALRATELDWQSAEAWEARCTTHEERQETDAALAACARALDLRGGRLRGGPEMWTALGELHVAHFEHDAARNAFYHAIEHDPRHLEAWQGLCLLLTRSAEWNEADKACKQVSALGGRVR